MGTRPVVIVAFAGVQPLDVVGPAEVFHTAARLHPGAYEVSLRAPRAEPVRASSVALVPDAALGSLGGRFDTLVVAGGSGVRALEGDAAFLDSLRGVAGRSRRVAGVCTGAFLLAAAGLLDGRRATTHWAHCPRLADAYPEVSVDPEPIFIRDGAVYTSAGVTAGMDLALALVEEDLGAELALEVARWLVLFVKRPGGQAQFSAQLTAQRAHRRPLRDLQGWITGHLSEDLSVPALAARAHMSERNFARAFGREVGMTPAAYVETARVESARMALESGDDPVEAVARAAGFGTVRRAFHRRLGVGPADYRGRFRSGAAA